MRINIEIDDQLIRQALKLGKIRTKREVVEEALKSYVAEEKQLLALKGKVVWEDNLQQMRSI